MLEIFDQGALSRLPEEGASGTESKHASDDETTDLLMYHLRECKNVAVDRARKTFDGYLSELEVAFNLDISNASAKQHKVDSVVEKVLGEIKQDVRSMTDTLVELTNFTRNVTAREETLNKRNEVVEQGQRRLRAVKIRVYDQVMQRTRDNELPSTILLFLFQPWTDYLCYTALRHGDHSPAWSQALAIMDNVIWAIKPKHTQVEIAQLAELREPLMQRVREGFRVIRYEPNKSQSMIAALIEMMDRAVAKTTAIPASNSLSSQLQKTAQRKAYQSPPRKDYSAVLENELVHRLRKLEFGAEVQFENGDHLRLAWSNVKTSHFMMVEVKTQKARMMTGLELAQALLYKKAHIVPPAEQRSSTVSLFKTFLKKTPK